MYPHAIKTEARRLADGRALGAPAPRLAPRLGRRRPSGALSSTRPLRCAGMATRGLGEVPLVFVGF